jgi:hypothetical protein
VISAHSVLPVGAAEPKPARTTGEVDGAGAAAAAAAGGDQEEANA